MEYTEDEVRERFLKYIWDCIEYWDEEVIGDTRKKLEGLAITILAMLDGESPVMPRLVVSPHPHLDDMGYHARRGEKWYPESGCDIAGCLHELFHKYKPESV